MRSIILFLLAFIFVVTLCGCDPAMMTDEDLIERARTELDLPKEEPIEITIAGQCSDGPSVLFWFITEYDSHLLMECTSLDRGGHSFERTYTGFLSRGIDLDIQPWKSGYVFLISNPSCTTLRVTDFSGTRNINIPKDQQPFMYYHPHLPEEYLFLDVNGAALK